MPRDNRIWPVVLAGGDGTRLNGLSRDRWGRPAPKQYAAFAGDRSMLSWALTRASSLAPEERVSLVVAEQHRQWWVEEHAEFPSAGLLVQPLNRGTAPGVLLPLLHVYEKDPEAILAYLPSDHYVENEGRMRRALARAARAAATDPERVVVLGVCPDDEESDYGWILPGTRRAHGTRAVTTFVEKPDPSQAWRLRALGGLWSTFVFVGSARTLLDFYAIAQPQMLWRFLRTSMAGDPDGPALDDLYAALQARDFSRDVLQRVTGRTSVLAVGDCGWSDLGTPARLAKWHERAAQGVPASGALGRPELVPAH